MSENVNLPDGWQKVKLSEIIEEVKERNITNNKEYPILTSSRKGIYIQEEYFNRVVASENLSNYKIIRKNEFTYRSMSDDQTFVFNRLELLEVGLVSPAYYVFKAKNSLSTFIKYFLNNSQEIKSQISKVIEGTTRTALRFNQVLKFVAMVPPLPEQRKIAEILETIDNAIEKTDAIIEKYKRIKQGLMQDLLTKGIDENGNIRDEKTHKFKDSPLGRIPEEWEVGYVSNFTEINPITKINPKELYPFIEMDATPIMGKQYKYITLRRGIEAGSKFKKGDILLARITPSAENGKALLVPDNIEIGIGSTEFIVFRAKENIDNNFLFYLLISNYVRSIAIGLMEGTSGRQRIPKYVFEKVIKVAIPKSKSEQQRIASILSQIDEAIEKEQAYKEKLERIKKGLMEDLLTGKVRVNHLIEEGNKDGN
ncbi:restriction endonuclease S subunit [Fervidobacterium pennivorans DSM 9078]|uniref:Restriction endonuclease S subunit n=2 Tax=Fervidobacterium pennivorans TaxID=93466 RepID=H9UAZ6_FERPD|nr:restriction endonuclease S subunit [Fervidobacterium pennivorans DSM 9078]